MTSAGVCLPLLAQYFTAAVAEMDETQRKLASDASSQIFFARSIEEDIRVVSTSRTFQIAFGALLGLIILFRLILFASIIRLRKETILQLGQSSVLAVFVLVGAFCIGSCYLLMPLNDTFCLLREPFILTPLTLMGNILFGRLWRITVVMSPVLTVGKGQQDADLLKTRVMDTLTFLSDYEMMLEDIQNVVGKAKQRRRKQKRSSIRQKIALQQLIWLIVLLEIPQLVMQTCNLAVTEFAVDTRASLDIGRGRTASLPAFVWNMAVLGWCCPLYDSIPLHRLFWPFVRNIYRPYSMRVMQHGVLQSYSLLCCALPAQVMLLPRHSMRRRIC